MFGRRPSKATRSQAARLGFESLESRIVMTGVGFDDDAAVVAATSTVDETTSQTTGFDAGAALLSTEDWVHSLQFWQFNLLAPDQVQYLTTTQVASIPSTAYLNQLSTASRASLSATQVRALNISAVGISSLTSLQLDFLTAAQIQQVKFYEFQILKPAQIPFLTTEQIASIPTTGSLVVWSQAARNALTATQIGALDISKVGLEQLTNAQLPFLTASQIQQVKPYEFVRLSPAQIPYLSTAQITSISTAGLLSVWSQAARDALTATQVRALDVSKVGLESLSNLQVSLLTVAQVQQVKFYEFQRLNASQAPLLTAAQIASISTIGSFSAWEPASRNALNTAQVKFLNISILGLGYLTAPQIYALTATQVQQVKFYEFASLSPLQIPSLSVAQMASMPTAGTLAAMSIPARAALTATQVRAINVANVGIELLTPAQTSYLTATQIQQVKWFEFTSLSPAQIPLLTLAQIASMPEAATLSNWTAEARAALTFDQVRSVNIGPSGRIAFFTSQQIAWLTIAQVRAVKYYDLQLVDPSQAGYLTTTQMASIPTPSYLASWPKELLSELVASLVRAINVASVGIRPLPPTQIGYLSVPQIQSVSYVDFECLLPAQIPYLTATQLRSMPSGGILSNLSDASQAALTREQILSLPLSQLAYFTRTESAQYPPAGYQPVVDQRGGDGSAHAQEAMKFYNLAPLAAATHVTIASGAWSDPSVWRNGKVPAAGAKVVVSAGTTILFDSVMNEAIDTLRIDGTLSFATYRNTQLYADSIIVFTTGKLFIGTAANPISDNVTARVLIADGGPIDRVWDPYGLSRGLMSGGEVKMYGKNVTSYVPLTVDPAAGDVVLRLSSVPTNWKVGDRLVISGVNPYPTDFGAEEVTIRAINGTSVTVDKLKYSHNAPDGQGLSIYVANMTRNIVFEAEDSEVVAQRPHMVFFGSPNVHVENIAISGFGRTDKSQPINDPVVINGVLQPGTGTNPRARYAMHFHHTGVDPLVAPAYVSGSVITDSPGWGFVNHQSNVIFDENVAYNVKGSAFVTEDGNEIGSFTRNLALNTTGASWDSMHSRRAAHDFAFNGHGFWMQGPGVELIGNIVAGARSAAYVYFTSSARAQFDAVNLADPSMAGGLKVTPVGVVPLKEFSDNVAAASHSGLEVWFHQMMMTDGDSRIERFTSWNTILSGIALHYSGNIQIDDAKLIGDLNAFNGYGVSTNSFTHDVTINNLTAIGFEVGVDVPVRRATMINGAMIAAVQAFQIEKGFDTVRSVAILGQISISNPTALQLRGRIPWKVYLYEKFDFQGSIGRRLDSYTSADQIVWAPYGAAVRELYFNEQVAWFIPFPTATASGVFPSGYLNLNNFQLSRDYGVAYNGQIVPADAVAVAGIRGYAGPLDL
ncbi:MAG: hypothetical protein C0485_07080 [Pirellula sp.]|nr:hypothetical protein [Pirellula sp.]